MTFAVWPKSSCEGYRLIGRGSSVRFRTVGECSLPAGKRSCFYKAHVDQIDAPEVWEGPGGRVPMDWEAPQAQLARLDP